MTTQLKHPQIICMPNNTKTITHKASTSLYGRTSRADSGGCSESAPPPRSESAGSARITTPSSTCHPRRAWSRSREWTSRRQYLEHQNVSQCHTCRPSMLCLRAKPQRTTVPPCAIPPSGPGAPHRTFAHFRRNPSVNAQQPAIQHCGALVAHLGFQTFEYSFQHSVNGT